jgi:hypothetical protein
MSPAVRANSFRGKCRTLWAADVDMDTARRGETAKECRIRLLTRGLKHFARRPRRSDVGRRSDSGWFKLGQHESEAGREERWRGRPNGLHSILQRSTIEECARRIHNGDIDGRIGKRGVARGSADGRRESISANDTIKSVTHIYG